MFTARGPGPLPTSYPSALPSVKLTIGKNFQICSVEDGQQLPEFGKPMQESNIFYLIYGKNIVSHRRTYVNL